MADTTIALLDTPKRQTLSALATTLRTTLKDWEKSFAASHNHRKPDKDDIKACTETAKTYKEYNRVRDVLAGKLPPGVLSSPTQQRRTSHIKRDSSINGEALSEYQSTPPKKQSGHPPQHSHYVAPVSASPRPLAKTAIGPTPQRDGKVLGLFDMLSGRRTHSTPSTRKRKIDALMEGPGQSPVGVVAQTPTKDRRHDDLNGNLVDHLNGTPQSSAKRQRHSRTPASAGKKFMLSQFFATPPSMRVGKVGQSHGTGALNLTPQSSKTPLRTHVLSSQPEITGDEQMPEPDATPAYLRRSHSFKDRLLSVTSKQSVSEQQPSGTKRLLTSPSRSSIGPQALHTSRSAPKPLSEIVRGLQKIEDERHDDDLEALRELEDAHINVLLGDSQTDEASLQSSQATKEQVTTKVWRKKGQKRTTRRSHIRPVKMRPQEDIHWGALNSGEDDENIVEETQLGGTFLEQPLEHGGQGRPTNDQDAHAQPLPDADLDNAGSDDELEGVPGGKAAKSKIATGDRSRPKKSTSKEGEMKGSTINPNAVSHMNFRSLKIKNKNSKAQGSRARFGRKGR